MVKVTQSEAKGEPVLQLPSVLRPPTPRLSFTLTLTQARQRWEQRGPGTSLTRGQGVRASSGSFTLAGGLEFLVYLLKIIISFFHKSSNICQGDGEAGPIEIRQGLSSWGDPGFSF